MRAELYPTHQREQGKAKDSRKPKYFDLVWNVVVDTILLQMAWTLQCLSHPSWIWGKLLIGRLDQ